jgi:uncharacterized membrane protein
MTDSLTEPTKAKSDALGRSSRATLDQRKSPWNQLLGSKLLILGMLFGVTGFLGLPVLWMSPVFSQVEKWLWSVANVIYTLALIGICFAVCYWAYSRIFAFAQFA